MFYQNVLFDHFKCKSKCKLFLYFPLISKLWLPVNMLLKVTESLNSLKVLFHLNFKLKFVSPWLYSVSSHWVAVKTLTFVIFRVKLILIFKDLNWVECLFCRRRGSTEETWAVRHTQTAARQETKVLLLLHSTRRFRLKGHDLQNKILLPTWHNESIRASVRGCFTSAGFRFKAQTFDSLCQELKFKEEKINLTL